MTSTEAAGWGQGAAGLSTPRLPLTPPGLVNRRLCVPWMDAAANRTEKIPGLPLGLHGEGGQLGE